MRATRNAAGIAAWLLGRPLTEQDGVCAAEVALAEQRPGFVLPAVLADFYLTVGRQPAFMSSFQQFARPDQWTVSGDKIVFLEENQGVCYWAADARSKVYQATSLKAPEWHEEPVDLPEFLSP